MYFPDSWFEDEVRDGFYIPALMKRAWAAQLEVLEEITKICDKYHIRWFATYGTLLGAVRHGGFIPWDDDLDITMFREDYNRFNQVAAAELPDGYYIPQDSPDEYRHITRVCNGKSICVNKERLERYHGFPYVAGVDIFALDYIAPDPKNEETRKQISRVVRNAALIIDETNQDTAEMQDLIARIETLLRIKLDMRQSVKNQLYSLCENLFSLYAAEGASAAAYMPYWIFDKEQPYPLRCFCSTVTFPFETVKLPSPVDYNTFLQIKYGDYMTICRGGGEHNYPGYRLQEAQLTEALGKEHMPFRYQISREVLEKSARSPRDTFRPAAQKSRREIVFLPWKASMWDKLEPYWKEAVNSPDCDVYVIPVPYYYRNLDGSFRSVCYEGTDLPDYVPVTDYSDYDFETHYPDVVFIQNPYDGYNLTTSVHPLFYSERLRQYTDHLVYIPWFTLDETEPEEPKTMYNMRYYAAMPGVIYADAVIVQSEPVRKAYIDFLSGFVGEETRTLWEDKIKGGGRHVFS